MEILPFKYYRLYITKNANGNNGYFSMNTFSMFETNESTTDLCIGATATASSNYNASTEAPKAIDNNASTYWETASTAGDKWFQVELPAAKKVRKLIITTTNYQGEMPSAFIFQGSNDNVNWTNLKTVNRGTFGSPNSYVELLSTVVGGKSVLDSGDPSLKVILFNWQTMQYIIHTTPNASGDWFLYLNDPSDLLITHIGPSGFQPISDGPVTPMVY